MQEESSARATFGVDAAAITTRAAMTGSETNRMRMFSPDTEVSVGAVLAITSYRRTDPTLHHPASRIQRVCRARRSRVPLYQRLR